MTHFYDYYDLCILYIIYYIVQDREALQYAQRVHIMRINAIQELVFLSTLYTTLYHTAQIPSQTQTFTQTQQLQNLQQQVQQYKEQLTRKNKVITGLKAGKEADSAALSQWKEECRILDDQCKR
jgi:hypothetical protein